MKHLLHRALVLSLVAFATTAQADRPCKPIVEACMSAGVIQSGASRQSMIENCVQPVVAGKQLKGVKVNPSTIQACKAKMAANGQ